MWLVALIAVLNIALGYYFGCYRIKLRARTMGVAIESTGESVTEPTGDEQPSVLPTGENDDLEKQPAQVEMINPPAEDEATDDEAPIEEIATTSEDESKSQPDELENITEPETEAVAIKEDDASELAEVATPVSPSGGSLDEQQLENLLAE